MTAGSSTDSLRIGARFPSAGVSFVAGGMASAARRLEEAGYDSLWASDHLAMPAGPSASRYPYTEDGCIPWGDELGWNEALTALGIAAAVTNRIELGTAVLVAALRHPLVAARQAAAVATEAGGRVTLGVGAGWLAEEFEAVGVPFAARGRHLDAWLEYVRQVWTGGVGVRDEGDPYPNPSDLISRPLPPEPIRVVVGGVSAAAFRRVVSAGDGWIGISALDGLDTAEVRSSVERLRSVSVENGRDPDELRVLLQITGSADRAADLRPHLPALVEAGVDDVLIDTGWDDPDQPARDLRVLRNH